MPNPQDAGFIRRFAAFCLSIFTYALVIVIILALSFLFHFLEPSFTNPAFWILILEVMLAFMVFESILQGIYGFSIAKLLLGLRLVDYVSAKPIGVFRSLLRTVFASFSTLLLGLGHIAIAFNREHRSLHDLLSSSRVIEEPLAGSKKMFRTVLTFISSFLGLLLIGSLIVVLAILPKQIYKVYSRLNQFPSIDGALLKSSPEEAFVVQLGAGRIVALLQYKDLNYIEFELDPQSPVSSISETTLIDLGAKKYLDFLPPELTDIEILHLFNIPQLTFKDIQNHDLKIKNQIFTIAEKNVLGLDVLSLFDYEVLDSNGSYLSLRLPEQNRDLIAEQALDADSKAFVLYTLSNLKIMWDNYLSKIDPEILAKLSAEDTSLLVNLVTLQLNTHTGYVTGLQLKEASPNEEFNRICEEFATVIPRFTKLPSGIKDLEAINLDLELRFKQDLK